MSIQSIATQPSLATVATAASAVGTAQPARGAPTETVATSETAQTRPETQENSSAQKQQLEAAVKAVKDFIQPMAGNLEFSMDDDTGKTVIKIVDSTSGELIRQIPSKEMLEIAKALDRLQGLLVRQKA